ncbi:MAG: aminoacyl-tRNA hydrolase [Candidatus Nanopelagicales bacterium]|nr:aminoacyl-tRNA hydrolase [Candidatus Nanopelagicales bacterium]
MTWMIVGLGNPGPEYATTRHNVGFMVVDELAARMRGTLSRHKRAVAGVVEGRIGNPGADARVVLVEPWSFMNTSGGPVKALMQFYDVAEDHLVVIHDELDLPLDTVRIKIGGGDNGHNGLKSIRKSLGNGDYARVRIGIGRPVGRQDPADFVLKSFAGTERDVIPNVIQRSADAVETLVLHGIERAQNEFNGG